MTDTENFYRFRRLVLDDRAAADKAIQAEPELVHARNGVGETVMHWLAVENCIEEVKWLLSNGADINTRNEFGDTPLAEAACLGYLELCRELLEHGADPRIRDDMKGTALGEAAKSEQLEVLILLLDYVKPNDRLSDYFSKIDFDVLLNKEGECFKKLMALELPWE